MTAPAGERRGPRCQLCAGPLAVGDEVDRVPATTAHPAGFAHTRCVDAGPCRYCSSPGIGDGAHVFGNRKCCPDCDHRPPAPGERPLHPVRIVVEKWRREIPVGALSEAGQLLDDVEAAVEAAGE